MEENQILFFTPDLRIISHIFFYQHLNVFFTRLLGNNIKLGRYSLKIITAIVGLFIGLNSEELDFI